MCYNRDRILKYNMRAKKQKESGSASGTAEKWIPNPACQQAGKFRIKERKKF